jgi:hypothetical protein
MFIMWLMIWGPSNLQTSTLELSPAIMNTLIIQILVIGTILPPFAYAMQRAVLLNASVVVVRVVVWDGRC